MTTHADPTQIRQAMAAHDAMLEAETPVVEEVYVGGDDAKREEEDYGRLKDLERRLEAEERRNVGLRQELEQALEFVRKVAEQGGNISREAAIEEERKNRRAISEAMLKGLKERGGNVVILIHPNADPKQNGPVPLCHNGTLVWVPRGKPVSIHHRFVEILEHAVSENWVPVLDKDDNPRMTQIDLHSYNYSIINQMPVERPDIQVIAA